MGEVLWGKLRAISRFHAVRLRAETSDARSKRQLRAIWETVLAMRVDGRRRKESGKVGTTCVTVRTSSDSKPTVQGGCWTAWVF